MNKLRFKSYLSEKIDPEFQALIERTRRLVGVRTYSLMADGHVADDVAVGSVLATQDYLYPRAIGKDIGCGMLTVPFDLELKNFVGQIPEFFEALQTHQPLLKNKSLAESPKLPATLECSKLHSYQGEAWERMARIELGTIGRGNHFVEFQYDESGRIWLLIHTGSRAIGQQISLSYADSLKVVSEQGQNFLADMDWALRYAHWNRVVILNNIAELMDEFFDAQRDADRMIHNNHDHIREEDHFGEKLWVHRKGANSCAEGEAVIIAGSMASPTYHVLGKGEALSLRSCSHGAGRCMSRSEARKRVSVKSLLKDCSSTYFDRRKLQNRCEEAPSAYKDIDKVVKQQKSLFKVTRKLIPILNYRY